MWFMIQRTTAAKSAGTNPSITNPGTSLEVASKKRAFITNVNKPRVNILIGRVKIITNGLIKALIMPRIRATISDVVNESTLKPGRYLATIRMATALKIQFTRTALITIL